MAHEVFICYANQDKKVADEIYSTLKANNITCWMAPQDITAGEDWDQAIMDAIPLCHVIILVFSAYSNDSPYCIGEIRTGFDLKKEILPILIDDTIPHGRIALYIGSKHWFYANTPPLESHLKKIVDEVKKIISQHKSREEAEAARKEKERRETEEAARKEREKREAEEAAHKEKERQEAEAGRQRLPEPRKKRRQQKLPEIGAKLKRREPKRKPRQPKPRENARRRKRSEQKKRQKQLKLSR